MRFRLTISRKITLGFGLFILVVAVVLFITTRTLNQNILYTQAINNKHTPALLLLNSLKSSIQESATLAEKWPTVQSVRKSKDKLFLDQLIESTIPEQVDSLNKISNDWETTDQVIVEEIDSQLSELLIVYQSIQDFLPNFESYNEIHRISLAEELLDHGSFGREILIELNQLLDGLIQKQQRIISENTSLNKQASDELKRNLKIIFLFVLILGVAIAFLTIRSILVPIKDLRRILLYLGKGKYPQHDIAINDDEIGEMAFAVNRLVKGLKRTTEFANEVGSRNFDVSYEPLSEDDELGHELLKMRDDLAENERYLEQKVKERTDEVVRQKVEIEVQKEKVDELYKDLTDSINYAKRLQQAILPSQELINEAFPESFVLFRPKSIVSGDFYWFTKLGSKYLFSVVDCTGHGVPGAFMSLLAHNAINQAVKSYTCPAEIMNEVNRIAFETMHRNSGEGTRIRDGMDMCFCVIDSDKMTLEFSGAYNPVYLVRKGELIQIDADKMAIGSFKPGEKLFSKKSIKLDANDALYLFSDGYADQFGGERGKKFMKRRFKNFILKIAELPMYVQQKELYSNFIDWQGREEQVDDICVFGVKISADAMNQ